MSNVARKRLIANRFSLIASQEKIALGNSILAISDSR